MDDVEQLRARIAELEAREAASRRALQVQDALYRIAQAVRSALLADRAAR